MFLITKKLVIDNFSLIFFSEALNMSALKFEQQAAKLKRKMWWRNVKVRMPIFFKNLFAISLSNKLLKPYWEFIKDHTH